MTQNKLTTELRDNTSLAPHFNRAEKTGSSRFPNRVAIAVTNTGYQSDEKGTFEWLEGYPLSNDPAFYNAATGETNLVRVRRNTVNEGVKSITDKRTANNNMGTDNAVKNKVNTSYSLHRHGTMQDLIGPHGAHPQGGTVVYADFPTNIEHYSVTQDPNGPKVVSFTANYVGVLNKYEGDENRPSKTEQKMARLVFHQTANEQDTVFLEVLDNSAQFKLEAQTPENEQNFKNSRDPIFAFMGGALSNKDPSVPAQYAETARRTGFLMMKLSVLVPDGNGGQKLKELDSTLSKLYPSREELSGPDAFDPITGEFKSVTVATDNVETLTNLATAQDKATLDYLSNPTNPDLRRRAKEADVQRAFLHAVSGRPLFGKEEEKKPLIAVNDPEHLENVSYIHDAAVKGNVVATLVSGTKAEFYKSRRLEEAGYMRQAYDRAFPGNPGESTIKQGRRAHRVYDTLVDGSGGTGTFGLINIGQKSITSKDTSSPGSFMVSNMKTADANSLVAGPSFTSTPDPALINQLGITHVPTKGIQGRTLSMQAKAFADNHFPLYATPDQAHSAYKKKMSQNSVEPVIRPETLKPVMLGGQIPTEEQTKNIGAGLKALLEGGNLMNSVPAVENDMSGMLEAKAKQDEDVLRFAQSLADRVKQLQAAQAPAAPAVEQSNQAEVAATPKRNKPR